MVGTYLPWRLHERPAAAQSNRNQAQGKVLPVSLPQLPGVPGHGVFDRRRQCRMSACAGGKKDVRRLEKA